MNDVMGKIYREYFESWRLLWHNDKLYIRTGQTNSKCLIDPGSHSGLLAFVDAFYLKYAK